MLKEVEIEGKTGIYSMYCPGCKNVHLIFTESKGSDGERWNLTGMPDKPTLDTDVIIFAKKSLPWILLCRFSLSDGVITYDPTCPHQFAGKQVKLSDAGEN